MDTRRTRGEGLFAEQREGAGGTERRERSHRSTITKEDIGLGCVLEVGKLEQALREAGQELLATSAGGSEGKFPWGSPEWLEKGRQEARETGIKRGRVKKKRRSEETRNIKCCGSNHIWKHRKESAW